MKTIIVGGGAAGMMCAALLGEKGIDVTLVEKNKRLGMKLNITGKGRCNLTNACDTDTLIKNTVTNPRFMYSAFSGFNSDDVISFINGNGLATKVERGNRVFPVSDKAMDVTAVLEGLLKKYNVRVLRECTVKEILTAQGEDGSFTVNAVRVKASDGSIMELGGDAFVLATGGLSYPLTGSTGDGFTFARKLGLDVKDGRPSLVQLKCREGYCSDMAGLTLKNTGFSMYAIKKGKEKLVFKDFGEMLFTHTGISGPVALSASAMLGKYEGEELRVELDLKTALDADALDKRILRDFETEKNKHFINSLDDLLPKSMITVVVDLSGIEPHKQVNSVTKEERAELVRLLKHFPLTVIGTGGMDEAIITRGGISVKEIDPKSMRIKKSDNLYVAGELIDVDAFTGGFNLQIAWSTAHAAAEAISLSLY
ncbi:MAG: NAD(P)/FAD-dependent oxidoreductase [Lachnospiraceae bacterium]|nr:NAD(P)/FAD-dependent oxidoreductase [Lachnospiraceae bacterium]